MVKATQLHRGMVIKHDGKFFKVTDIHHLTPGKGKGYMQTKIKNIDTGSISDHRFRSDETIERPHIEQIEMEFLYQDGDDFHFMNTETFDQIHLTQELLGDAINYLVPNIKMPIEYIEGNPVGVELPVSVDLKIIETEPELKGAQAGTSRKPAKTETGLVVQVPPFIKEGETVRVSTEDGTYQARA
jgi:elongation factor P